ncbi:hypothetical protein HKD37_07G018263 [Glycine soja]
MIQTSRGCMCLRQHWFDVINVNISVKTKRRLQQFGVSWLLLWPHPPPATSRVARCKIKIRMRLTALNFLHKLNNMQLILKTESASTPTTSQSVPTPNVETNFIPPPLSIVFRIRPSTQI